MEASSLVQSLFDVLVSMTARPTQNNRKARKGEIFKPHHLSGLLRGLCNPDFEQSARLEMKSFASPAVVAGTWQQSRDEGWAGDDKRRAH